jgi:hypothetical protein
MMDFGNKKMTHAAQQLRKEEALELLPKSLLKCVNRLVVREFKMDTSVIYYAELIADVNAKYAEDPRNGKWTDVCFEMIPLFYEANWTITNQKFDTEDSKAHITFVQRLNEIPGWTIF